MKTVLQNSYNRMFAALHRNGLYALMACCLVAFAAVSGQAAETAPQPPKAAIDPAFLDDDLDFLEEEDFQEQPEAPLVADPLKPFNRAMFTFNDRLYFYVMKPTAKVYRRVLGAPVRQGVKNFFHNLATPVRMGNCLLQGKFRSATAELGSFVLNSTAGGLGFGNPARDYPILQAPREDLGQTLGHYHIGDGFYIVLPFLGPTTLRDAVGTLGDRFLNPITYADPAEIAYGLKATDTLNTLSFHLGDYETLKQATMLPYEAMRDGYIKHRHQQIAE